MRALSGDPEKFTDGFIRTTPLGAVLHFFYDDRSRTPSRPCQGRDIPLVNSTKAGDWIFDLKHIDNRPKVLVVGSLDFFDEVCKVFGHVAQERS